MLEQTELLLPKVEQAEPLLPEQSSQSCRILSQSGPSQMCRFADDDRCGRFTSDTISTRRLVMVVAEGLVVTLF
jgi:hypothetical protein